MFSLLIPSFNVNLHPFVGELLYEARQLSIPFELIIEDDASAEVYRKLNRSLSMEPEVSYIQNNTNKGRSKVRNHLADMAHYPYLIFLDSDARVGQPDFLSQYLQCILNQGANEVNPFVVLGGVAYRDEIPESKYRLRLHYGRCREVISAEMRSCHPYRAFTPFNVLITKSVFNQCRFDESFCSYGFEDTLFGIRLQQLKIPVYHIDNPLFHDGLDTNEIYLEKVKSSIKNLINLINRQQLNDDFIQNSKLLMTYYKCRSKHVLWLIRCGFVVGSPLLKFLILHVYSLLALDLYKLGYLTAQLSEY